ncbi:MAG: 5'/3'-nucleotidase SurE [Gammaproteobacteria bacterium]
MRRLMCLILIVLLPLASAEARSLDILLTNDDGWDSAGIEAVAAALRGDGHRVTIVAPLTQQSGSGMKITLGELALTEQRPGVWSLAGSPADAVGIGLAHVLAAAPPDLVVSGANFGQNLGNNVMISGTVGAAMMAVLQGVPAVAVSVGLDLAEAAEEPRFASTLAAFPGAARLTARLVAALAAAPAEAPLLPPGTVLNVNYPARPDAAPGSVSWAPASAHGGFVMTYEARAEAVKSGIAHDAAGQAETGTDTGRFARGEVTLTLLRPDWNTAAAPAPLAARIDAAVLLAP